MARPVAAIALYVALSLGSISWLNEAVGIPWAFAPQVLACICAGWLLREWSWVALALGFAPVVLAEPFGQTDHLSEGVPIALMELILFPAYVVLILAASHARKLWITRLG